MTPKEQAEIKIIDENETYEEYKLRKGITNVHQASIILGLDTIAIISKKLEEMNKVIKTKTPIE